MSQGISFDEWETLFDSEAPSPHQEIRWGGYRLLFALEEVRVLSGQGEEGRVPDCWDVYAIARSDSRIGRLVHVPEPLSALQGEVARYSITRSAS